MLDCGLGTLVNVMNALKIDPKRFVDDEDFEQIYSMKNS